MVEAPGVEGRRGTLGLVESRDASRSKPPEREQNNGVPSTVSGGDGEARCSTGVSGPADEPKSAPRARLIAVEHLLDAVLVLLEAEDVARAMALLRGWRAGD